MKKCCFAAIRFLLVSVAVSLFFSCSDILSNSSDSASVKFSLSSKVLKEALSSASRNITGGGISKYEDGIQILKNQNYDREILSYTFELSLKGDYSAKKSISWSEAEFDALSDDESDDSAGKSVASITFESVPVGKRVFAQGKLTYKYKNLYGDDGTVYESALYHGSSETIKIAGGTNYLSFNVYNVYADFPFEVTLQFPEGTDVASVIENFGDFRVYVLSPDSAAVKNINTAKDELSLYEAANSIYAEEYSDEYEAIYVQKTYDYETDSYTQNYVTNGTTLVVTSTAKLPVSITDKNSSDEVALVPAAFKWDGSPKAKYVGTEVKTVIAKKDSTTALTFDLTKLNVPDTATVLYSKDSADTYNYTVGYGSYSASTDSFAFDRDGEFYVLSGGSSNYSIQSSSSKFASPKSLPSDENVTGIAIDLKTNTFYTYYGMQASLTIKKYPNLISEGTLNGAETVSGVDVDGSNIYYDSAKIAIYDGVVYILTRTNYGSGDYVLGWYNTADSSKENINLSENEVTSSLLSSDSSAKITDMHYQNGAVYMLVRDVSDENFTYEEDSPSLYSRGAVLKVNPASREIKALGFSKDSKTNEDLKNNWMYTYKYDDSYLPLYKGAYGGELLKLQGTGMLSENGANTKYIYSAFPTICTPRPLGSSFSDSDFYGAQKFIAIKPKKLVIADDGIAIYTNSDGALSYKNVNRVVTVDLESFAIDKAESVEASFDGDCSSIFGNAAISTGGTGFWDGNDINISLYYSSEEYISSGTSGTIYLGIPCGE